MNQYFTSRAAAAVKGNYELHCSADLLQNNAVAVQDIPLEDTGASVTVDGAAAVRRTFSMNIPDVTNYLPLTPDSLLSPFLTEIRIWLGIRYDDGTIDRWPVFTGEIEDPKVTDDDNDMGIAITASDRAQSVSERRSTQEFSYGGGSPVNFIAFILNTFRPGLRYSTTPAPATSVVPNATLAAMDDPWQFVQDLAAGAGLEVFFNGLGTCVIRPIPDPDAQIPVWTFAEGSTAMLKEVDMTLTAKDSFSHASVQTTNTDSNGGIALAPLRSDRYDLNPNSPTYFDPAIPSASRFGDRPVTLDSSALQLISTQAQCDAAAQGLINRKKGAVQNVVFTCAPVTALDEHDVVRITRNRTGIDANYTLESFNIPCTPDGGDMKPTCRSRRV